MENHKLSIKQQSGYQYETIAERYLLDKGLTLVTKNFSCPMGEIDLIMKDNDTLVFIEVRFRKNCHYGSPLESITRSKQKKIIRAAKFFLSKFKGHDLSCRFDAVGITPNANTTANTSPFNIVWIPAAFYL